MVRPVRPTAFNRCVCSSPVFLSARVQGVWQLPVQPERNKSSSSRNSTRSPRTFLSFLLFPNSFSHRVTDLRIISDRKSSDGEGDGGIKDFERKKEEILLRETDQSSNILKNVGSDTRRFLNADLLVILCLLTVYICVSAYSMCREFMHWHMYYNHFYERYQWANIAINITILTAILPLKR